MKTILKIYIFLYTLSILYAQSVSLADSQKYICIYHLRGSAEKMAYDFGIKEQKRFVSFYKKIMQANHLTPIREKLAFRFIQPFCSFIDQESMLEIRAFAKAAQVSYNQVLLANCYYEFYTSYGCRQAVAWGDKTKDQTLIHARNLDWPDWGDALRTHNVLLIRYYSNGNAIATLTWPGMLGSLTGCNNQGIALAFNQLYGGSTASGEPIFFLLKRVLRKAKTLSQALAILKKSQICTAGSIIISSAKEKGAVLVNLVREKNSSSCYHVFIKSLRKTQFLVNDNTCYFDKNGNFQKKRYVNSAIYKVMEQMDQIDVPSIQKVMAHPKVMQYINILTAIFELEHNTLYLAYGHYKAAKGPYQKITLFKTH